MTIPKPLASVIVLDPEILGGTPCFTGTRVPLATFLDYVEIGYSLDRFLRGFTSVRREQATAFFEWQVGQSRLMIGLESVA